MAVIAFLVDGEIAHFRPTINLAQALSRSGHAVHYLGFASLQEVAQRAGYLFHPVFQDLVPGGHTTAADAVTTSNIFKQLISGEALDFLFDAIRPDVVITLTIFASMALIIKFRYKVPMLLVRTHCAQTTRKEVLATVMGSALVQIGGSVSQLLTLLKDRGRPVESLGQIVDLALQLPEVVLTPAAFGVAEEADPMLTYIGVDVAEDDDTRPFEEAWLRRDDIDPRPLVFCSLGTRPDMRPALSMQFFRNVIRAIQDDSQLRLILSTGNTFSKDEFPDASNVHVHRWVPQLRVLQRSTLMITHGGLGSVRECISRAIPMIVFPVLRDQFCSASIVSRLGIGLRGTFADCSPATIHSLVRQLLTQPEYRSRISAFRYTDSAGIHLGQEVVEGLIRSPVLF